MARASDLDLMCIADANPWVLAQMGRASSQILFWIDVLIAVVLISGILWVKLRRDVLNDDQPDDPASLIDQLRRARDTGMISPEEYQASREALLGRGSKVRRVVRGEIFEDGTIRARPGFDLTGTPLPDPPSPPGGRPPEGRG